MLKSLVATAAVVAALVVSALAGGGAAVAEAAVTTPVPAPVVTMAWPKDVVYVYDTTASLKLADGSPRWPVAVAAERWDDDNPVDFRYTTKACPKDSQCVVVRQQELAAPTVGSAATAHVGSAIVSSTVILDTTFGKTNSATRRRNVVCHELGHTLGLQHRTGTTSCMTSYVTDQRNPDKTDVKALVAMYQAD